MLSFAGLVVLAGEFYPIPFRTRPSKLPAPMVLRLKPRESRSLPVLPRTASWKRGPRKRNPQHPATTFEEPRAQKCSRGFLLFEGSVRIHKSPAAIAGQRGLCFRVHSSRRETRRAAGRDANPTLVGARPFGGDQNTDVRRRKSCARRQKDEAREAPASSLLRDLCSRCPQNMASPPILRYSELSVSKMAQAASRLA